MTEPILTREEIAQFWLNAVETFDPDKGEEPEHLFAAAIEAAVLEKVCGEPVAYASEEGLRMLSSREEVCIWSPDSPLRRQRDIPIFTLTRSKP